MYGAMYVTTDEKLPALEKDPNIPPSRQKKMDGEHGKDHASHAPSAEKSHPYELKPPYLYRAYMEDASPASIAVHLPHQLSYCWDASTCELRYAWEGGFVDNTGLWKGKPNSEAKVLGTVFFRGKVEQPLRIGDPHKTAVAAYKGYKLIDRYPEFHYTLNGVDIYELIQPKEDGTGLIRTFRIPEASRNIWLYVHPKDGLVYESEPATRERNRIMISPAQAKSFRVVMTKKEGLE
jgi:hypothetical protein